MVANPKKIQRMFRGLKGQRRLRLNISENKLSATDHVKLLGIEVGNKLKSSKHVFVFVFESFKEGSPSAEAVFQGALR